MNKTINMLLIEDDHGDALLTMEVLRESQQNISIEVAGRLSDALERIRHGHFDIILMDLGLPDSNGFETFARVYEKAGDTPVVVFTGLSDENMGLHAVNQGAQDYVCKGELNGRSLARTLRYAIERKRMQGELADKIARLEEAITKVKQLEGILPICMYCKKIRDDKQSWQQLEQYISEHSEAFFSHSICPACLKERNWDE